MFEKALNVFKVDDLRRRIVLTLVFLFVYRFGYQVPIPGIPLGKVLQIFEQMKEQGSSGGALGGFIKIISTLSAGDIYSAGIFSLGIMPYISSSIIFSILAKVIPQIEQIVKEGSQGQKRLNQWMRWGTIPICLVQAVFVLEGFVLHPQSHGINVQLVDRAEWGGTFGFYGGFYVPALLGLTCGTIFLMWIGEQITEYGVGNGISLLIMAGILARVVQLWHDLFATPAGGDPEAAFATGVLKFAVFTALYLGVTLAVVYVTKGSRRIPVQYARMVRGSGVYAGAQKHYLPLKVNQANVMPVIFASSLMAFPAVLFSESLLNWSYGREMFRDHSWLWTTGYVGLIFFFSFFWVQLMFQPSEMAKNMKEYGAFIPGIRPGKATAEYLDRTMARLTLAGCFFLTFISLLPDVVSKALDLQRGAASLIGGTSILIVVAVALDLVDRMNAQLLMRNYEGFMKGAPK
ncbi:MAG: preprotein translocase subunit SecY [Planctomycetes bacterium]|nr:preprotein translocase subunit SecY [Planctomycetota bacterium]